MSDVKKGEGSFAPGDIVQLKSFGPPMTVVSLGEGGVDAIWYDEVAGDVKTRFIPSVALVRIELSELDDEEDDDEEDEWREEEIRRSRAPKRRGRA